ncbi:uncharacterized protein LOC132743061 [Ruditapes philippinarum]|uniref:uncharacterized protein LOC132743061 n=1 Tax=Ruditapes philippinarum TaxID=129788 RepID=UPI00295AA5CA|nr:uncharacterized protein LOC132743061 [Ruditapes philippinarum]
MYIIVSGALLRPTGGLLDISDPGQGPPNTLPTLSLVQYKTEFVSFKISLKEISDSSDGPLVSVTAPNTYSTVHPALVNITSISCTKDGKECDHINNARCNNQFGKCECLSGYIMDAAKCNAVTAAKKHPTALPALETKKVGLDFAIEVGNDLTKFDVDLTDPNSPKYKEFKHSFETKLISVFNDTKGYSSIEVTGFRKGSIIADYRLILNSFDVAKNALSFIKATVVPRITNISPIQNLPVNKQFVQNIMEEKLKTYSSGCEVFSKDICPVGFTCKTNSITHKHYCENLCIKDDKPLCGDKGECYVDAVNYTARCSCISSDGYVYHGEHCEHKTEELKMNSKYIIAIGAGCGGALLLITVVSVICFVRLKRTKSKSPIDDKDTQFKSMGMMDIRRDRFGGQRESFYAQRKNTIENEYHSGLPNQDIKYLQGREHKIFTRKRERDEVTFNYYFNYILNL